MSDFEIIENLTLRKTCRLCDKDFLEPVLSLGNQFIINFLDSPQEKILAAPLEVVLCNKIKGGCGLLQLKHTVPPDILYRKFWYKSGVNQTMRDALQDIVVKAEKIVHLKKNEIVVDIGANDGSLLRFYSDKDLLLVGFEPATNLLEEAKIGTTLIVNDYFSYENFNKEFPNKKAKVITCIAMFYDLENPNVFVNEIKKILDINGIWIIQMNYLPTMLKNNAFDNISHEHLEYYSLKSLEYLLDKFNLDVFDAEFNDVNGGSIRIYIKHKECEKYHITDKVKKIRDDEEKLKLETKEPYDQFVKRIIELKEKTYEFIKKELERRKKVYVYGASTRGNTLLQFFNLNNKLITAAADRNPMKWGKKMVGTEIPIISEEQARKEKPDYFLVLPWYFIEEFKRREEKFLRNGGKFIVPLPKFQIIDITH